jgi:4,5-DOPA dioxygenase extradiol
MTQRMPAIFLGHGNPMHALHTNDYTEAWKRLGESLPRPRAILAISAHWYVPGVALTASTAPPTIHDFGGFPKALFDFQYPAPGDPALARRVQGMLAPLDAGLDAKRGLDHGVWAVLCHVFPGADIPVVQLSMDATRSPPFHYEIGQRLAPLRDQDVLVIASGNVVHNLHTYAWGIVDAPAYDWATRFDEQVQTLIRAGEHDKLIEYETLGRDAMMSVPTPEHYLPLLYVLGLERDGDSMRFPVTGMEGGSVSMLSVCIG